MLFFKLAIYKVGVDVIEFVVYDFVYLFKESIELFLVCFYFHRFLGE